MRYTWDKKLILRLYKDKAVREELTGLLQTYLGIFDYLNNSHFPLKEPSKWIEILFQHTLLLKI